MLTLRKLSKEFHKVIDGFRSDMNNRINHCIQDSDIVTCEFCGCAVKWGDAYRGRGVVKQACTDIYAISNSKRVDYIYYPYYCKLHKQFVDDGIVEFNED